MVGPRTLAKGLDYATSGRVVGRIWDRDADVTSGTVRGSEVEPYEVSVRLVRVGPDRLLTRFDGTCSCPVGHNCKHAVALVLPGPGPQAPPPATERNWSRALSALLADPLSDPISEPPDVGLQLELVAQRPAPNRRSPPGGPGIRLRPVAQSPAGNWIRSGISWTRLDYYGYSHQKISTERLHLLLEIRALAQLSGRSYSVYGEDSLWLESIDSRRLWDLFDQAVASGIPLVPASRSCGPITLERGPVSTAVDITSDERGLAVRASGRTASGFEVPAGRHVWVGSPPHGVVWWDGVIGDAEPPPVHLARLAAPLSPGLRRLFETAEPISVPRSEVGQFEREMLPLIRRRATVRSSDEAVVLGDLAADTVVALVSHRAGPAVEVRWKLEAGAGTSRSLTDHPDPKARDVIDRVVTALGPEPGLTGPSPWGYRLPVDVEISGLSAARFVVEVLPDLEAIDGLQVRSTGTAPDFREVTTAPTIRFAGSDTDQGDWLDLAVEVTVEGEEVPFSDLFVALAEDASHVVLPSGVYFSLDRPELRALAELIAEARSLHDAPPGQVRLSPFQASLWDDLSELGHMAAQAGQWEASVLALAGGDDQVRPLPAGLVATLRPYQLDGFQWLATRYEHRLGAILADDMGLGKTVQALALISHAREQGLAEAPFLVVAPTSVVHNWKVEAERFVPDLPVVAVTETTKRSRRPITEMVAGAGLVITSYALFRLDYDEYEQQPWAGLLLDEAQFAKNPASHANIRARRLPAPWKLAMTGTPMENSLAELWALTAVTSPGLFASAERFAETYRRPIERQGDQARLDQLRRRLRPVMLRRTKEEVASDLPEKQEQILELELDPKHRRLYATYLQRERQKVLGLLDDMKGNRFEILRSLTLLRQAALDVSLVDPDQKSVPSTKLDALSEMLGDIVADGHRVLVFSQFTRYLELARDRLDEAFIEYCYLDGRTRRRDEVIARFREGRAPVFLISLKAGGFGLNLTEADYCVILDPWWNPAAEAQAVDRAHRIGQTKKVMVYRLVALDTIEEKVMALKDRKSKLFESVVGSGGFESAALTESDVRDLLG
jgi:superfamily II DNA or RNA helicase